MTLPLGLRLSVWARTHLRHYLVMAGYGLLVGLAA